MAKEGNGFLNPSLTRRTFMGAAVATAGVIALAGCSSESGSSEESSSGSEASTADAEATADLIVVGSGAAGLAAAARAAEGGASVIVLESQSMVGGTTSFSGGHYLAITDDILARMPERTDDTDATLEEFMNYDASDFGDYGDALTTLQEEIPDYLASDDTRVFFSVERWLVEHYLGTQGTDLDGNEAKTDYDAVSTAYYGQGDVYEWLLDCGISFEDPIDNDPGSGPISMEPEGQGGGYISALQNVAESNGADIITSTTVTGLIVEDDKVTGVTAKNKSGDDVVYAASKGVLLATGGFGSNGTMVADNDDCYLGITDTCLSMEGAGCDGEGLNMAKDIGADTTDMEFIQYFPNLASATVALESVFELMPAGKLAVNKEGERFTDDSMATFMRNNVDSLNQTDATWYAIGDADNIAALGDAYQTYTDWGSIFTGDTIEEAAEAAGLDGATVADTVEEFNGYCDAGSDPDFDRVDLEGSQVVNSPFIITVMRQAAQNTMGGLVTDTSARVLDDSGSPIEGLYAAGECVGVFDGAYRRHADNFAQIFYYAHLVGETVSA